MKTIATAAVLMMLAVPTWAADAQSQTTDPANSNEPIILSEAEMDAVTAGGGGCNTACQAMGHLIAFVTYPVEYVTGWLPD